ncbi:MAG: hypothetical protein NXI20_26395 [bacterium]|nr:hypothetical protein [bacterium]
MILTRFTLALSLLCTIAVSCLNGQSIDNTLSTSNSDSKIMHSSAIGERYTSRGSIYVSPGFHHLPFPVEEVDISTASDLSFKVSLNRNPQSGLLIIESEELVPVDVDLVVYNIEGREINIPAAADENIALDFAKQEDGIYYLVLEDYKRKKIASFKIVLIDRYQTQASL